MPTIKTDSPAKIPPKTSATRTPKPAKSAVKATPAPAPLAPTATASVPVVPALASTPTLASKPVSTKVKTVKAAANRATLARRASVMLKFVSDPTRLQVILFLAETEHHVGALCEQLGQSQPAVSHHLALLRHGGIIWPRRSGKNNFYSLSETGTELAKVVKSLLQIA